MHLRSDSFSPYDFFPARLCFGTHDPESHIALAGNRNPHLAWDGAPEGTQSFVILCVDVDVPSAGDDVNQEGKRVPLNLPRVDFFHWVLCDLPASVTEIAEGTHSDGITAKGKALGASVDAVTKGKRTCAMLGAALLAELEQEKLDAAAAAEAAELAAKEAEEEAARRAEPGLVAGE